ncbi:hypothetical protein [Lactobacillus sp. PSON]|uniref:hypothetical protein n=1 Tax=Lactobacillus sp. PSON TaxID=3455454 RepID=UPI004041187E
MKAIKPRKVLLILLTSPLWIFILFCIFNTCQDIYLENQKAIALQQMQKVTNQQGYEPIDFDAVKINGKFITIYDYQSSFSTKKTLKKNKILFRKNNIHLGKYDELDSPYKYSISAAKFSGKWKVYIKEEPFGKEKVYTVR